MRYQLVLQFRSESLDDFDRLVMLEQELIGLFGHEVDGHDCGGGEFNIFILTDDPLAALAKARVVVEKREGTTGWRAGYRESDAENYIAVWPPNLGSFDVA